MKDNKTSFAHPPAFTQSALWSWNLSDLDVEKDKHLIITQILNFGTQKMIDWVMKTYSLPEIKEVVENPDRGSWWKRALNHWANVFQLKIDKEKYNRAILNINPQG